MSDNFQVQLPPSNSMNSNSKSGLLVNFSYQERRNIHIVIVRVITLCIYHTLQVIIIINIIINLYLLFPIVL